MIIHKRLVISFLLIYVLLTSVYFLYTRPSVKNFVITNYIPPKRSSPPKPFKYILFWGRRFKNSNFYFGFGNEPFKMCPINNCYTTNIQTLRPIDEFDAILFHGAEYFMAFDTKPKKRSPKQVYVFANLKSPQFFPYSYKFTQYDFYNWTMTYRTDSDVVDKYGYVVPFETDYQLPTMDEIRKKPKKVAWLVSHCRTPGKREILYNKLKQYIDIDVYGKCGTLNCTGRMPEECYDHLEKNYLFYLAFENAVCDDYVTEKLYHILKRNLVPIVYGGTDYTVDAPLHSVINVQDFHSIEHLAYYLDYLIQNPEKYLEYFQWKNHYKIVTNHVQLSFCDLCAKLNAPIEKKTYRNINAWWSRGKCADTLPTILYT